MTILHWERGLVRALALALGLALCAGCGDTDRSATPNADVTSTVPIDKIRACGSLIELYQIRQAFEDGAPPSAEIADALQRRWDVLIEQSQPVEVIEEHADLLEFDYRKLKEEGMYRALWLLRVRKTPGTDFHVNLYCYPDGAHIGQLFTEAERERKHTGMHVQPDPPASQWADGDVVLVQGAARMPAIPFLMKSRFFKPPIVRNGKKVQDFEWEKVVSHGWQAGL